jgi:hypothetical protein
MGERNLVVVAKYNFQDEDSNITTKTRKEIFNETTTLGEVLAWADNETTDELTCVEISRPSSGRGKKDRKW